MSGPLESNTPRARWITAMQGLRAVSFLAIFVSHSGLGPFGCLGAWGVSVFLVMSGFLMAYQYLQKEELPAFGLAFAARKIRALYPLHIATMLAKLPIALFNVVGGTLSATALVVAIAMNVGMVQVWVPWEQMYSALNGPSWFMCVISLAYFLFPLLLKALRKMASVRSAILLLAAFLGIHLLASLASYALLGSGAGEELAQWVTYYFPPVRCCDFAIGCVLGWLYLRNAAQGRPERPTAVQALAQAACLALIAASMLLYADGSTLLGSAPLRYSLLFLPTTVVLIWLVASCAGPVERLWSLAGLQWIADLSPYAFLIHAVVLRYVRKLFAVALPAVPAVAVMMVALVITLACSAGWKDMAVKRKEAKRHESLSSNSIK